MITTPSSGSNFTTNLTFTQFESNPLPNWLSFNTSTANITSTNPTNLTSDTYTITNTYTGITGSSITLTTNVSVTVTEDRSSSGSGDGEKYCFDTNSELMCGIVATIIVLVGLVSVTVAVLFAYTEGKKIGKGSEEESERDDIEESQEHHSVQEHHHQPIQMHDIRVESATRGINMNCKTSDNKL